MTDELLTIRQMCDIFGVTPRALRFYESKELLAPQRDGQRRLYGHRDRARLKLILRGKRFGFSLEEIRQLLDLYHIERGEEIQFRRAYDLALQHLADMERRRDELDDAISELKQQIAWGETQLAAMDRATAAE
jgi:DNA-binding transcriptional MerR regulator